MVLICSSFTEVGAGAMVAPPRERSTAEARQAAIRESIVIQKRRKREGGLVCATSLQLTLEETRSPSLLPPG